jgi:nitrogen-specific signal transduction histidine kinase
MGVALVLANVIVEDHGGWIDSCVEEDQGTRFEVYLPRLNADNNSHRLSVPVAAGSREVARLAQAK